jgi:superfamily II DNA or RNA helicase
MALKFNVPAQTVVGSFPLRTGAMSQFPYSSGLAARFAFKTRFEELINGTIRQGNTLLVPREAVPYAPPPNDYRISYPPLAIDCKNEWRGDQAEFCQKSLNLLRSGRSHIVQADTGYGKTVCGSWIAAQLGQPTLIVVNKEDLVDQWRKALLDIIQVPPQWVGHVQGDVSDWQGKRFVIGMVQSLIIPGKYPQEFLDWPGLLLLDEVDTLPTECFIRSCQMFAAKYRLGMSATPERKDGKSKLLQWHIGPVLVTGKVKSLVPKVLVKQTGWQIPPGMTYVPGQMTQVTKALAASEIRNYEIINFVVQSYKAERNTLVLSELREFHLDRLFSMLTNALLHHRGHHRPDAINGLEGDESPWL